MAKADPWFHNTIINGLQWLSTLSLRGAPQPDVLPATTEAWVDALWSMPILWDEERDRWRLGAAFKGVAATTEFWPAPAAVYKAMPPVRQRPALPPPIPELKPDRKAALLAIRNRIALQLTSEPGPSLRITKNGADTDEEGEVTG